MAHSALKAIGTSSVTLHVNHRGIFNRFLAKLSLQQQSEAILRVVDKLAKLGEQEVLRDLEQITGTADSSQRIIDFIKPLETNDQTLAKMEELSENAAEEVQRIRKILSMAHECGIEDKIIVDPSITRGLDYYTGVVFETFLNELPSIGSVCSGGRYNDLAGLYTKERIPGVGASIGLDRLIAALEQLKVGAQVQNCVDVELFCTDEDESSECARQKMAFALRQRRVGVDVFPTQAKMSKQYSLAQSKGVRWGIFCKQDEAGGIAFSVKNLATRESTEGFSAGDADKIAQLIKGVL